MGSYWSWQGNEDIAGMFYGFFYICSYDFLYSICLRFSIYFYDFRLSSEQVRSPGSCGTARGHGAGPNVGYHLSTKLHKRFMHKVTAFGKILYSEFLRGESEGIRNGSYGSVFTETERQCKPGLLFLSLAKVPYASIASYMQFMLQFILFPTGGQNIFKLEG